MKNINGNNNILTGANINFKESINNDGKFESVGVTKFSAQFFTINESVYVLNKNNLAYMSKLIATGTIVIKTGFLVFRLSNSVKNPPAVASSDTNENQLNVASPMPIDNNFLVDKCSNLILLKI